MSRRLVLLYAVLAVCGFALGRCTARAETYGPTQAEMEHDHAVATTYWRSEINPSVVLATGFLPYEAARFNWQAGLIELDATYDWRDYPGQLCVMYVHEYGHDVLGPVAFAETNPSDPAHSADPLNIMYGGGEPNDGPAATSQQLEAQAASVGCPSLVPPEAAGRKQPEPVRPRQSRPCLRTRTVHLHSRHRPSNQARARGRLCGGRAAHGTRDPQPQSERSKP